MAMATASKSAAEYPPVYLPGLRLRAVHGEDVDFVEDQGETKILVCLKHFSPQFKLFPENRSPTLLVTYTRGTGLSEDDGHGNVGRLKKRITKVFDIDETGAVDGYRGYYSYLVRLEEDANIDSIELDIALSLWSGKKETSEDEDSHTSRTGQLINVTHKYMSVGESYAIDMDDLEEDKKPQVIFLHWDFTNIEMRQMISPEQMKAFDNDTEIPLDALLLGAGDDQIYNPLEPLRFHVNLTGLEIKPEELVIKVSATDTDTGTEESDGKIGGKGHGTFKSQSKRNRRGEDKELALGRAAISRTPNKPGWVTFEFPAKYVILALLAAYPEEEPHVVNPDAVTKLIEKGQYNLNFSKTGTSDEQRLKTSISKVIRLAKLAITIEAPTGSIAGAIGKFLTEGGIQSNDMYFDSAVRTLKNRKYWNDQKLLRWSAMACLSTVADKDRLYPHADFKAVSVESRAGGNPADGIQRFELILEFPSSVSFDGNLVSVLVQNCDPNMGFLGIDSSRRFMYQEKPDTVKNEKNGRRRIKFKWIAIDSLKTPRFILIKASAILHASPQNGIMKAADGDKKIGPTVTFMVKVGEENNDHTITMDIQNEETIETIEAVNPDDSGQKSRGEVETDPPTPSVLDPIFQKVPPKRLAIIAAAVIWVCILFLSRGSKTTAPVEFDAVEEDLPICDLYMGQSAIPGMGIGIFTNRPIEKGQNVAIPDVILNVLDYSRNFKMSQLFTPEEGIKWKETAENKTDKKDDCAVWAIEGECENHPDFMLLNCEKSCALAAAKMDLHKALGSKHDVSKECTGWAQAGQCTKNPYKMLEECPVSCAVEEYGLDFNMHDLKKWVAFEFFWSADKTQSSYEASAVDSFSPGIGALANAHPYLNNVDMSIPSIDNIDLHRSKDAGVGAFSDRHNLGFVATKRIPAGMEIFVDREDGWFIDKEEENGPMPLDSHHKQADEIIKNFFKSANGSDDAAMRSKYQATKNAVKKVRVKMVMPDTLEEAREALSKGTTKFDVNDAIRSQTWLVENGICLDGLRVGRSTLPQAGRGAFANRDFKKGQVIAPMPLIQADKNRLRHFVGDLENNGQLMLNYSYGHRNSSLLLIPYSPAVSFVNHHNRDKSKVNARLQWSTKEPHDKSWEEDTVEEILSREYVGLMLELVATSDIKEGDEVFLDYGSDWDDAWESYLQSWKDQTPGNRFVSIDKYNSEKIILTVEEQASNPYTVHVMTTCWVGALDDASKKKRGLDWKDHRVDMDASVSGRPLKPFECTILSRYKESSDSNDYLYEADISPGTGGAELLIHNVPRNAIEFVYKPYKSDQHIDGSFRQNIQIPDEIFPEAWMDLRSK